MGPSWTHLVRFIADEDNKVHLGQIDVSQWPDVGLAIFQGQKVQANVVFGDIFEGRVSDRALHIKQVSCTKQHCLKGHRQFVGLLTPSRMFRSS